ncbi:MAG: hypothetical protein Kow006_01180 [Gammaproteobacteria bacterium]
MGFGNLRPLLHQICDALEALVSDDRSSAIDLRALPFSPGEEQALKQLLGNGEASALLKTLGDTELWETAYPGVWWVEHRNSEGERIAQSLEITWIPEILKSQPEDVQTGRQRLEELIKTSGETRHEENG